MMNNIGKFLVLVHTAISILALTWAAGIFLQFTDWGWMEPRKDIEFRVPSEYDKRTAAYKEAVKARELVIYQIEPAQTALVSAMKQFPKNHLYYVDELKRLRSSPDPIEVREIKYKDGQLVLDVPAKEIGKPVLEDKVEGIQKSYDSYVADFKKINTEIDDVAKEIRKWTEEAKDITFQLNGKDDTGKVVKLGLYALLEVENKAQAQARFEKEYIQPFWARALEEAELFIERRARPEATLQVLTPAKSQKLIPKPPPPQKPPPPPPPPPRVMK